MVCMIIWFREKDPQLSRELLPASILCGIVETIGWLGFIDAMVGIFGG